MRLQNTRGNRDKEGNGSNQGDTAGSASVYSGYKLQKVEV